MRSVRKRLSAAVTIVFNTLLAWIKDAYDPLNSFMAALTGHHWITHSLANVTLFFTLSMEGACLCAPIRWCSGLPRRPCSLAPG